MIDKVQFIEEFNSNTKIVRHVVAVDTEYESNTNKPNIPITVQIDDTIYEDPFLELNLLKTWNRDDPTVFIKHLGLASGRPKKELGESVLKKLTLKILFYFSFADITGCFRYSDIQHYLAYSCKQKNIVRPARKNQKTINTNIVLRSHDGVERLLYLQPHDLSGLLGKLSLHRLMETLGMPTEEKEIFTKDEKGKMMRMYTERPNDFREYAKNDAMVLYEIESKHSELWVSICSDLSIPVFNPSLTIGSNTVKVSRALIVKNLFGDDKKLKLKFKTVMGGVILSSKYSDTVRFVEDPELMKKTFGSSKLGFTERLNTRYKKAMKRVSVWKAVAKLNEDATAKNLLKESPKRTSQLLALVDGGRCRNERPTEATVSGAIADIDISSCYGTSQLNQLYPIGRPVILDFEKEDCENPVKDPRPSLGEFIHKYKDELVDGLWYARVSTTETLSFEQDLLISKIPPSAIKNSVVITDEDDFEPQALQSDFIMLTKELVSATLTSDLLEVLKSVCSNKEWSELMNKVVIDTYIFYPKSMRVDSIDELIVREMNPARLKTFNVKYNSTLEDTRSRHWTTVKFSEGWIDVLKQMRESYPKKTPMNEMYKLIINTTYGVITSEYFDVNNVVVASNITARARTLAWLMAKALGSYQTITDGGAFDLNNVRWYDDYRKPSMNTLCHTHRKHLLSPTTQYRIKTRQLGEKKWEIRDGELYHGCEHVDKTLIDEFAWLYVKAFFKSDKIKILRENQFDLETKDVYAKATFQGAANNRFEHANPNKEPEVKARGYEIRKQLFHDVNCTDLYEGEYPIIDCMERIGNDELLSPFPKLYTPNVLKVNSYKKISKVNETTKYLLPGDQVSRSSHLRPVSVSAFKFQTYEQYRSWLKKSDKLKQETGKGLEIYFINKDCEYDYQKVMETLQQKIDSGLLSKCLNKL